MIRGAEQCEMIGRTSEASRFNVYEFSEVLGLRSMEEIVSEMIL